MCTYVSGVAQSIFRLDTKILAKRIEDIVLGSIILLVVAVPIVLIAALIKFSSTGKVFFYQWRHGLNNTKFRILKFRTMTVTEDGPTITQVIYNDPRVTIIGKILRRTSLDEFPQFLQVITGEMSLVGPRPHAVAHNEFYCHKIHNYMVRHSVKPGITGWAQVNGWRGETQDISKMEQRVKYDLEYVKNWNILWDLKIIFLTVFGSKCKQNAL
jgi:putative colanic acid biosysnthesis UDP-glucose lipid carrier transferase